MNSMLLSEKRTVSQEERKAIRRYKEEARKLPWMGTLLSYLAPDFQESVEAGMSNYDALLKYVSSLREYTKVLKKAAHLRNDHYECFIKGKFYEDPAHRVWREGMLAIARDAQRKLERWASVERSVFDTIVFLSESHTRDLFGAECSESPIYLDAENVEDEISLEKNVCPRPGLTCAEKRRRKKIRAQEKKRREREELAMMERCWKPLRTITEHRIESDTHHVADVLRVYRDHLSCHLNPFLFFEDNVVLKGSVEEKEELVGLLFETSRSYPLDNGMHRLIYYIVCKDPSIAALALSRLEKEPIYDGSDIVPFAVLTSPFAESVLPANILTQMRRAPILLLFRFNEMLMAAYLALVTLRTYTDYSADREFLDFLYCRLALYEREISARFAAVLPKRLQDNFLRRNLAKVSQAIEAAYQLLFDLQNSRTHKHIDLSPFEKALITRYGANYSPHEFSTEETEGNGRKMEIYSLAQRSAANFIVGNGKSTRVVQDANLVLATDVFTNREASQSEDLRIEKGLGMLFAIGQEIPKEGLAGCQIVIDSEGNATFVKL